MHNISEIAAFPPWDTDGHSDDCLKYHKSALWADCFGRFVFPIIVSAVLVSVAIILEYPNEQLLVMRNAHLIRVTFCDMQFLFIC